MWSRNDCGPFFSGVAAWAALFCREVDHEMGLNTKHEQVGGSADASKTQKHRQVGGCKTAAVPFQVCLAAKKCGPGGRASCSARCTAYMNRSGTVTGAIEQPVLLYDLDGPRPFLRGHGGGACIRAQCGRWHLHGRTPGAAWFASAPKMSPYSSCKISAQTHRPEDAASACVLRVRVPLDHPRLRGREP
jgi:hypothetical protein